LFPTEIELHLIPIREEEATRQDKMPTNIYEEVKNSKINGFIKSKVSEKREKTLLKLYFKE